MEEVAARPRGQCRTKPPSSGAAETRLDARSSGIRHLTPNSAPRGRPVGGFALRETPGPRSTIFFRSRGAGWLVDLAPTGPVTRRRLGRKQSMWLSRTTRVRTTHLWSVRLPWKTGRWN
jgi:hypothetical protein